MNSHHSRSHSCSIPATIRVGREAVVKVMMVVDEVVVIVAMPILAVPVIGMPVLALPIVAMPCSSTTPPANIANTSIAHVACQCDQHSDG